MFQKTTTQKPYERMIKNIKNINNIKNLNAGKEPNNPYGTRKLQSKYRRSGQVRAKTEENLKNLQLTNCEEDLELNQREEQWGFSGQITKKRPAKAVVNQNNDVTTSIENIHIISEKKSPKKFGDRTRMSKSSMARISPQKLNMGVSQREAEEVRREQG